MHCPVPVCELSSLRYDGVRTLRTQDISALVPKCPRDTLAPVPKCLGSEVSVHRHISD